MNENPSKIYRPTHPVERVHWNQAKQFCQTLSKITGKNYQLPSEAQWEYACRANTTTKYYFGDNSTELSEYAWYENILKAQTLLFIKDICMVFEWYVILKKHKKTMFFFFVV